MRLEPSAPRAENGPADESGSSPRKRGLDHHEINPSEPSAIGRLGPDRDRRRTGRPDRDGTAPADDEAFIVTPPGFNRPGQAKTATGEKTGRLRITVRDRATGRPTPCRVNVVGPDGHFYQPAPNPLSPYSLTGQWPKTGKGNREGKAPIRYLGRFFYTTGDVEVAVPAGSVRVEAWKGFEYRPVRQDVEVAAGQRRGP